MQVCHRVQNLSTFSNTRTKMFFDILYMRIFSNIKGVDAVMLTVMTGWIVNTTTCDDDHIGVIADIEGVVNKIGKATLGHNNRYMHTFVFYPIFYNNINATFAFFWHNFNFCIAMSCNSLTIFSYIKHASRCGVEVGNLFKQFFVYLIHFHLAVWCKKSLWSKARFLLCLQP